MADKAFVIRLAATYLGLKGANRTDVSPLLDKAYALVADTATPRHVCAVFPVLEAEDCLLLGGTDIRLTGDSVKRHLHSAKSALLTAFTLGAAVDVTQKRLSVVDLPMATAFDAIASAYAESEADETLRKVTADLLADGGYVNSRYCCGYGDLPLATNTDICRVLSTDKIGVSCAPSGLLLPRKTIVGVVGVFCAPIKNCEANDEIR